jgi:hypothetical protein
VLRSIKAEITMLEAAVAGYETTVHAWTNHEKVLTEYEGLRVIVETEQEKKQQNLEENLWKEHDFAASKQSFGQRLGVLEKDKGACATALSTTKRDIERLKGEIVLFEQDVRARVVAGNAREAGGKTCGVSWEDKGPAGKARGTCHPCCDLETGGGAADGNNSDDGL